MLGEKFSHSLDKPLAPLAKALQINPNILTFIGMVITSCSGFIIPISVFWGGVFILVGGAFDLIDGVVSRVNGRVTKFGALLDSTLDRIADGFIFLGIAWHFFIIYNNLAFLFTLLCMIASFLISYIRAKAEGTGVSCKVGIIERPERIIILAIGCLTDFLYTAILILTLLSWITVVQRFLHVKNKLKGLPQ